MLQDPEEAIAGALEKADRLKEFTRMSSSLESACWTGT